MICHFWPYNTSQNTMTTNNKNTAQIIKNKKVDYTSISKVIQTSLLIVLSIYFLATLLNSNSKNETETFMENLNPKTVDSGNSDENSMLRIKLEQSIVNSSKLWEQLADRQRGFSRVWKKLKSTDFFAKLSENGPQNSKPEEKRDNSLIIVKTDTKEINCRQSKTSCGGEKSKKLTLNTVKWAEQNWLKPLFPKNITKSNGPNFDDWDFTNKSSKSPNFKPEKAVIFFWGKEPFVGFRDQAWGGKTGNCFPNDKCQLKMNVMASEGDIYKAAANSDAIVMTPVFDGGARDLDYEKINKIRNEKQIWTWFQWESPQFHNNDFRQFDGFFNASMSYRFDSTFWLPYSSMIRNKIYTYVGSKYGAGFVPRHTKFKEESKGMVFEKKSFIDDEKLSFEKLTDEILLKQFRHDMEQINGDQVNPLGVATAVSHCSAPYRGKTVKTLTDLIRYPNGSHAVDVYGACKSHYQKYDTEARDNLQNTTMDVGYFSLPYTLKNYKFYLSFENSRCRHYITEKFFSNAFNANSVPIVAGAPRADYEYVAPASSFIHVDDFKTIEDLAFRISYLIDPKNEKEYLKYFAWKTQDPMLHEDPYKQATLDEHRTDGLCGLCQAAFEMKNGIRKWELPVIDLHDWWYGSRKEEEYADSSGVRTSFVNRNFICLPNDRWDVDWEVRDRRKRGVETLEPLVSDLMYKNE